MTGMANFFYKEPDNKHFFFFYMDEPLELGRVCQEIHNDLG